MCGLLAYLSTDAERVDEQTISGVHHALTCLRHRGPDDRELWSDAHAVLGFNRLAVIDSEGAPQPLPCDDDRNRTVFNGEPYTSLELREERTAAGATFATGDEAE